MSLEFQAPLPQEVPNSKEGNVKDYEKFCREPSTTPSFYCPPPSWPLTPEFIRGKVAFPRVYLSLVVQCVQVHHTQTG